MRKPEYIRFHKQKTSESRKTSIVSVISIKTNRVLGQIAWYGGWRQYVFYPDTGSIWNPDCLAQISDEIKRLNKEHVQTLLLKTEG